MGDGIRSKKNSILVFLEELSGHTRLASQLPNSRTKLHVHVGKAVHAFANVRKILSVIAHMKHNELGLGVAGQHVVASFQQFCVTGKITAVERPIRMVIQFLEAFIEPINGKEECLRIRNMNRNRHPQRAGCLPHGVETWIVNFHQWPFRDSIP